MRQQPQTQPNVVPTSYSQTSVATSKVLKNTYMLLALTLAFSAFTAFISRSFPPLNIWMFLIGAYGLMFLTHKLANSVWGLVSVFAFTGFFGFSLGPILNAYLATSAGSAIVMQALGGTAITFLALSGYALASRKDFSFLNGFMVIGFVVLLLGMVASIFLQMPALQLAISAGFILFSGAAILLQTSAIIHGGERNYILATVTLYVSIYNIFMSLLNILTALGGDD